MQSNILCFATSSPGMRPAPAREIEQLCEFSATRYRPMLRLMEDSDLFFLKAQPQGDAGIARRLCRQRRQIFGRYLSGLDSDFRRATLALRILISRSAGRRLQLAPILADREIVFRRLMRKTRWNLMLSRWRRVPPDATVMIDLFDSMCTELNGLPPETRRGLAASMVRLPESDHNQR